MFQESIFLSIALPVGWGHRYDPHAKDNELRKVCQVHVAISVGVLFWV